MFQNSGKPKLRSGGSCIRRGRGYRSTPTEALPLRCLQAGEEEKRGEEIVDVGCQVVTLHKPLMSENIQNIQNKGPLSQPSFAPAEVALKDIGCRGN